MRRTLLTCLALSGCGGETAADEWLRYSPFPVRASWEGLSARISLPERVHGCATVRFEDLDGDGAQEMLVPHADGAVELYRGIGPGRVDPALMMLGGEDIAWRTPGASCPLMVQDLDDDGRFELVTRSEAGIRVLWLDGLRVRSVTELATPGLFAGDLSLWVSPAGARYLVASGKVGRDNSPRPAGETFTATDQERRVEIHLANFGPGPVRAWRVEGDGLREAPVGGDVRCFSQGAASTPTGVLLSCDFGEQVLVTEEASGLRARALPGTFAHGMGVAPLEIDERAPRYLISSVGGFVLVDERGESESLGIFPAVLWGTGTMDLNGDGAPDVVAPPNGLTTTDFEAFCARAGAGWIDPLFRALFFEGGLPKRGAWGLLSVRDGARVTYRPMEVEILDPRGMAAGETRDATVTDLDRDGRPEMVFVTEPRSVRGETGVVVVGRPLARWEPGAHALTVFPRHAAPFTTLRLECDDGARHLRRVFPSVERGGNRGVIQFTCATPRYRSLVVTSGSERVEVGGGAMDRALDLDTLLPAMPRAR